MGWKTIHPWTTRIDEKNKPHKMHCSIFARPPWGSHVGWIVCVFWQRKMAANASNGFTSFPLSSHAILYRFDDLFRSVLCANGPLLPVLCTNFANPHIGGAGVLNNFPMKRKKSLKVKTLFSVENSLHWNEIFATNASSQFVLSNFPCHTQWRSTVSVNFYFATNGCTLRTKQNFFLKYKNVK